jgi:uncharacterized spore protein YtfJ
MPGHAIPSDQAGVVVLPAARVSGGAGGGSGPTGDDQEPRGTGSGFGVSAKALGVFVIRADGKVNWEPALDVNRIILAGQVIAIVGMLVGRAVIKARHRRRRG